MKKKWWLVINCVILICCLIVIGTSIYHGVAYSKYYDKDVLTQTELEQSFAISQVIDSYNGASEDKVESFTYKVTKLSGGTFVENINCKNKGISITAKIKSGQAKIVIVDSNKKQLIHEPLEEKMQLNLNPGKYKVYMVGDWFSGKVKVEAS